MDVSVPAESRNVSVVRADLFQQSRRDVVDEPTNVVFVGNEWSHLQSLNRLENISMRVCERFECPPRLNADFGLELSFEVIFGDLHETAVGVMEENDLSCPEKSLRQTQ